MLNGLKSIHVHTKVEMMLKLMLNSRQIYYFCSISYAIYRERAQVSNRLRPERC